MRILVAEDEPNILLMYRVFLEGEGNEVTTARDGEECLHHYMLSDHQNKPFDVVILDYRMPKMNGRDVAKEILARHSGQTIIMITAFSKELTDFSGIEKIEVLQKPFELEDLTRLLMKLFEPKIHSTSFDQAKA
ncbi:response regulator with CheY-like receiver, AAA-type ATPase, and DNA-binding domains [Candidatus Nitrososphaera evergladensis SR1]|uniref:Response regulator with CheY-like receiver, AAA-type ATPase, and DNA-binding domains n=1 Tax=Candidatus Nitrososphaera evergladensis SR1 TaxID=1459636 RepID=A0A075MSB6_9ARCH|nr:response regulator with CheY-like receiver, AAA-type ATPase, and DNA-binding domains [Candidatus Nitrososphaera evergladensis SR1]